MTRPEEGKEYDHRWPHHLPGGGTALVEVLYEAALFGSSGSRGHDVAAVDLESGKKHILVENAGCPKYVSGHLLFGRDGLVYAAPLDLSRVELTGEPVPVLEGVAMWSSPGETAIASGMVYYDVSRDGELLFSPREARLPLRTLVQLDREGRPEPVSKSRRDYQLPLMSPDGRRIAVTVELDAGSMGSFVLDVPTDGWTRVRSESDVTPAAWMPDGKRLLLFGSRSENVGLLVAPLDGHDGPQPLYFGGTSAGQGSPVGTPTVAPDGASLLFELQPRPLQFDIWRLSLTGEERAEPWLRTPDLEMSPSFSPDGGWVAYISNESGRREVYVRAFADPTGRHQVSTQGGERPRWSRDGREIFFSSQESLWSAAVRTSPTFTSEPPRKLFAMPEDIVVGLGFYDVSPDGQHFVMVQKDPFELRPLDLVVVPGWVDEMNARLAAAK